MVPVRLQVGLTKPIKDETSELQPNAVEIETLLMGSLSLSLSLILSPSPPSPSSLGASSAQAITSNWRNRPASESSMFSCDQRAEANALTLAWRGRFLNDFKSTNVKREVCSFFLSRRTQRLVPQAAFNLFNCSLCLSLLSVHGIAFKRWLVP